MFSILFSIFAYLFILSNQFSIMSAKIIDGNKISAEIKEEVKKGVEELKAKGITPGLAVVLVGENPASQVYVRNKANACEEVGIYHETIRMPDTTTEQELLMKVEALNKDEKFHGILLQLPLPKHINETKILNAISPEKDVDGFHPVSQGKLMIGEPSFLPCTPAGVHQMLIRSNVAIEGKHVVVVGRSNIVGKPVAMILLQKDKNANATVSVVHSKTKNLVEITRQADILIVAIGVPEFIKGDMVKEGVIIIDVGINRVQIIENGKPRFKLVGDVHYESAKEKADMISPVPGGVGPMTVAMLMVNTLKSAKMMTAKQ